ncbi:hypothetical protein J3R82DRAFT_7385 [Butyriboletus roseoflavus]|nr:hypothetical protein J3R82DRAFT_7385 [Butyriboletus roseoflavus]
MTGCLLEHQVCFPSQVVEESVWEYTSRHVQLSVRGEQILDHLLLLLPTYLNAQPRSHVLPFPPVLLFSICDALRHGRADGPASDQNDTSVLPSVLSKLRDWRLLDADYRYSPGGIHKLALDLAGITDETPAPTSSDYNPTSHARLRMKWVSSDSPSESQDREPSSSTPPSPSPPSPPLSGVLVSAQECAYALTGLNERRSDVGYEPWQAGRLGTSGSEDASAIMSRRHHSMSGFRSGCSACRHPRISGPSAPPSPRQMTFLEQRTPFSDVNRFDTHINVTVASPRHPEPSVQRTTPKKTKRGKYPSLQSVAHDADENEPTLAIPIGAQPGIGISFPRQRTHYPRISNTLSSREPTSPAAASVQRRAEPSHLLNRAREGDKHTTSHRVASVDLRLPMTHRSPNCASSIDLHLHPSTTRTQSFPYTPVRSHSGLGSVVARVQKLSSNAVGSRSSKRLPSWSQSHLHQTTTFLKPTGSVSSPPAKASVNLAHPYTRLRPSSTLIPPSRVPSDMKHRDGRSVSSPTHKHTQSTGSLPSPPLLYARQWQV